MLSVGVNTKNQINNSGFVYDAAGKLTADGSLTMTYDAENRMVSTNAGVSYSYDGDGRRVRKSNGKLYWYGTSALDAVLETDLAGNNPTEYVFFGGKRIARRDPAGAVFYYFADHLGSSRIVTNATGTIVDESDYYPFGGERVVVNNDPNPYKFTGKERDSETGLDYMNARFYFSGYGRFFTPDPAMESADPENPQLWNRYTYANNNPQLFTDPNGESATLFGAIVGAVVGGATAALQGKSGKEILARAAGGAVAGAMVGSVIDTGGGSLVVYAAAGGLSGAAAGFVERAINGEPSTTQQVVTDVVTGAAGGVLGGATSRALAGASSVSPAPRSASPTTGANSGQARPGAIPATGPRATSGQRAAINEIGEQTGCHTCGAASPGTRTGNWVPDHQTPTALNPPGGSQVLRPQCLSCSQRQGGQVSRQVREQRAVRPEDRVLP